MGKKEKMLATSIFREIFSPNLQKFFFFPQIHWKSGLCCIGLRGRLISHMLVLFSTLLLLFLGGQCTYPCFPWVSLTSALHNILSKPLATFTHYNMFKQESVVREKWNLSQSLSSIFAKKLPNQRSSQWPHVLESSSCTLSTELHAHGLRSRKHYGKRWKCLLPLFPTKI